jgi:hypothetical protein
MNPGAPDAGQVRREAGNEGGSGADRCRPPSPWVSWQESNARLRRMRAGGGPRPGWRA